MKQITFPLPLSCTLIYPDGKQERVRYGQYEGICITHENGWGCSRLITLSPPTCLVEEVTRIDGVKIVFDKPFYLIGERKFGDGSGRVARRYYEVK